MEQHNKDNYHVRILWSCYYSILILQKWSVVPPGECLAMQFLHWKVILN